uniref:Uncharacterized protein n=2 Tax=Nicotiana TaxID=4085 RepID=A0A1S4B757_TOBAC|nr:PREDICTED: uncharacterized protein LOC104229733 [Nicotiana sylvestris]XP_016484699.1 PREDICTED: uncharacterized protein LOC107805218 [Nicotiana tabacum]
MAVVVDENCECISRKRDRVCQFKSKKYKNNTTTYESTCHGGCGGATWSESGSNESHLPENYTTDTGKGLETQQHEHHLESEISEQRKEEAEDNKKKDIDITPKKQLV